jgi:hypothetical protein
MIEIVAGFLGGFLVDSAITIWAVKHLRSSQNELVAKALDQLADAIKEMAPEIMKEAFK